MTQIAIDELDLTPRRRTPARDLCNCCFPKPPKFSPVYQIERPDVNVQADKSIGTTETTKDELRPFNDVEIENEVQFEDPFNGIKDDPIQEKEERPLSMPDKGEEGRTRIEMQQTFFLSLFHMLLSLLFFAKWGCFSKTDSLPPTTTKEFVSTTKESKF